MSTKEIVGKDGIGNYTEEAMKILASRLKTDYESIEFATGGAVTNESLKTSHSAFVKIPKAHTIIIRTDANLSIRLNAATNDVITLTSSEGSLTLDVVEVSDIFITTAGVANIKVILA